MSIKKYKITCYVHKKIQKNYCVFLLNVIFLYQDMVDESSDDFSDDKYGGSDLKHIVIYADRR